MRTGTVTERLKLSTVSAVTTDEESWFHCMTVRGEFVNVFTCLNLHVAV